jgi:uncharacterized protein YndB with AHSA1/START domain
MTQHSVTGRITINAPTANIWDVLTNPEKIVLYTGSITSTDWQPGSNITWKGEMHGMPFKNKGEVLAANLHQLLKFTYWSGMGGDEDLPENYSEITYSLTPLDNNTVELKYTRVNIPTEIETQIFQGHIQSMLGEIKKLSEL